MDSPMGADVIVVEDVLVYRRSDFGWHCEIQGRSVFVANLQLAPGCEMPRQGQRGPVTLTRAAADDLRR